MLNTFHPAVCVASSLRAGVAAALHCSFTALWVWAHRDRKRKKRRRKEGRRQRRQNDWNWKSSDKTLNFSSFVGRPPADMSSRSESKAGKTPHWPDRSNPTLSPASCLFYYWVYDFTFFYSWGFISDKRLKNFFFSSLTVCESNYKVDGKTPDSVE